MSKLETETKIDLKDSLYNQYNWFHRSFLSTIQLASNDFFSNVFDLQLASVSKNMNILVQGDDYFVTKIRIAKDYDAFFRCSEKAVRVILERILGKNKSFSFSGITELEARIISSFNDYVFNNISQFLLPVPESQKSTSESIKVNAVSKKRTNFDAVHLTFFIKDKILQEGGKLIVSLPQLLLAPEIITSQNANFDTSNFKMSKIDVKILIGTTKFLVKDLKSLEKDDLVIFENSDIYSMGLVYKDYKKDFKINPNLGLTTSVSNNGGYNMEESSLSQNLWDNIQVEMGAEFEKVKITLGELKHIEQGLVVDINSVYDNKVFLKVEDKIIAQGELVIINDRYGVRIDEVFSTQAENIKQISQVESGEETLEETQELTQGNQDAEDEFDYSDFELDDQDI